MRAFWRLKRRSVTCECLCRIAGLWRHEMPWHHYNEEGMVRGCRRKTRITRHQVILFVLMCQSHAPVFSTARSRAPLLWRRFVPFHSCRFRDVGGVVNGPWDHNPLFRHLVAYLSIFLSCHLRTLLLHVGYLEAPLLNLRPPPPPPESHLPLLPPAFPLSFALLPQYSERREGPSCSSESSKYLLGWLRCVSGGIMFVHWFWNTYTSPQNPRKRVSLV